MSDFTYNPDLLSKKVKEVLDCFIDYYGEERIDIQIYEAIDYQILIWFPEIVITNEFGESTTIYDFYFIVIIDKNGKYKDLKCIKSTFTKIQYFNHYIHSHATSFYLLDMTKYSEFCMGESPLRNTSEIVKLENNKISWEIFCGQLDDISKVESVFGGPYIKINELYKVNILETINLETLSTYKFKLQSLDKTVIAKFISYFLHKNNCIFSYCGYYTNGEPLLDVVIKMNNLFIEWLCTQSEGIINHFIKDYIKNVKIESDQIKIITENNLLSNVEEVPILYFKQEFKKLKIIEGKSSINTKMINPKLLLCIYLKILIILNNYENRNTAEQLYL